MDEIEEKRNVVIHRYEMAVVSTALAFVIVDQQLGAKPGLYESHQHLRLALHNAVKMYQEAVHE